ncbi:unnamed protein product, partial [Rodentolepis nana]|uniref:Lactamase_B domain-containing protein n=1 Tax=Rodentolepis nana TaxID=102285 RepID=A0A0R3THB8_RODNA
QEAETKLTQVKKTYWGRFANPWPTWEDTRIKAGLVMPFASGEPNSSPDPNDPTLNSTLPIHVPKFFNHEFEESGVRLTWLGHSSVLFQIDGARVLCDPIFSDRCSASSLIGPRRYRPPPCKVITMKYLNIFQFTAFIYLFGHLLNTNLKLNFDKLYLVEQIYSKLNFSDL